MTKEEAIKLAETSWWEDKTDEEIVTFQLFEPLLCMPFALYHKSIEVVLKRSVWTHEFADVESLQKEFHKIIPTPDFPTIFSKLYEIVKSETKIIPVIVDQSLPKRNSE